MAVHAERPALEVLRNLWIGPEPEESVLKLGLSALSKSLGSEGLLDFPKRPNGTPLLMRQGFFERLLKGQSSLRDCGAADVSAASGDVRHLNLKQLLAIRCNHLDFNPSGVHQSKACFITLLGRFTMALLAQRLLGEEELPDAHRALVMRHVVLIYGAHHNIMTRGEVGGDWWLVAVGGERRYLHLPRCELICSVPPGYVHCYRSHSIPDLRDPRRARVFRWQVLLVSAPASWTEDPTAAEQNSRKHRKLRDANDMQRITAEGSKGVESRGKTISGQAVGQSASAAKFSLFDDDLVDLYDQADNELDAMFDGLGFDTNDDAVHTPSAHEPPLAVHAEVRNKQGASDGQLVGLAANSATPSSNVKLLGEASPCKNPVTRGLSDRSGLCSGSLDIDDLFEGLSNELDQMGPIDSGHAKLEKTNVGSHVNGIQSRYTAGDGDRQQSTSNDSIFDSLISELDCMGPSDSTSHDWGIKPEYCASNDVKNGSVHVHAAAAVDGKIAGKVPTSADDIDALFDNLVDEIDHLGPNSSHGSPANGIRVEESATVKELGLVEKQKRDSVFDSLFDELDSMGPSFSSSPQGSPVSAKRPTSDIVLCEGDRASILETSIQSCRMEHGLQEISEKCQQLSEGPSTSSPKADVVHHRSTLGWDVLWLVCLILALAMAIRAR